MKETIDLLVLVIYAFLCLIYFNFGCLLWKLGMRCYSCKDGKHLSHNCPFLHYTPKRLVLLKNYAYSGF